MWLGTTGLPLTPEPLPVGFPPTLLPPSLPASQCPQGSSENAPQGQGFQVNRSPWLSQAKRVQSSEVSPDSRRPTG